MATAFATPPPQINHDLKCYNNYSGDKVEEVDQEKDWGGVSCKEKMRRYRGEVKGGKKQEDE